MDETAETSDSAEICEKPKLPPLQGDPWDRQQGESPTAFEAFRVYLEMGTDRSQVKAAKKLSKSTQVIKTWATRWQWVRRIEAWTDEENRLFHADMAIARRDHARRTMELARQVSAVGSKALREQFGESLEKITDGSLDPSEILKYIMEAAKLERTAIGAPDSINEQQLTGGPVDSDRKPVIPLAYVGRIEEALGLLEAARAREADRAAGAED